MLSLCRFHVFFLILWSFVSPVLGTCFGNDVERLHSERIRAFSLVINFYPNVSAICVSAHSLSILHFHVSQNFHDFRSMLYDLCFFRFDLKNTVMSECCDFLGVSESKIFSWWEVLG